MPERTPFVTIGGSLSAGAGDFRLSRDLQESSFAARVAAQLRVPFPQSLLEPPGLEIVPPGYAQPPLRVPAPQQWAVREDLPPGVVANISFPGMTLSDALHLRPSPPVVQPEDAKATAANVLLGLSAIALQREPLTPLEYALALHPDLVLVELGYSEALAAAAGAPFPESRFVDTCFCEILGQLNDRGIRTIVATIPNPYHTAAFSTVAQASEYLRIERDVLVETYALAPTDLLTPIALMAIGSHFFGRGVGPLPDGAVKPADAAARLSSELRTANHLLIRQAQRLGARVFDLASCVSGWRERPIHIGARAMTTGYLGGLYSLTGCYPGVLGHALIANQLIRWMNASMGARVSEVDLTAAARLDPACQYRSAAGPMWSRANLPRPLPRRPAAPTAAMARPAWPTTETAPITLPPSLECVVALNPSGSYFGDAIAAIDTRDGERARWGSTPDWLFGGFAMVDSHLHGSLRFRFRPSGNGAADFDLSFAGGLRGEDSLLVAPQLFEMPFQHNRVDDVPDHVSTGTVNLATGEVTALTLYARYSSTALLTLVEQNPTFPREPLTFPGPYGTAIARFEQRPDGVIDFTFGGTTFVPLGAGIRWPLPFGGPTSEFASVPANGTVMHPHLYLTTKLSVAEAASADPVPVALPANTVREFVLHTHNSAFGDAFHLTCPDLGGTAKGRSHVMGRLQVQFGAPTHGCVPVACSLLGPAGIFARQGRSPISEAFPGQLSTGAVGYFEMLRFPLRTYALDDLAVLSDTFDISAGLVDCATGRFLHPLLHRGFIYQDLIFALLRVEQRTPRTSFNFRGPAGFDAGVDGRLVFRFAGDCRVPYPSGFLFPRPDLSLSFTIGPNSILEPFLWIQAREYSAADGCAFESAAENVMASTGDVFSYRVAVDGGSDRPVLEYHNHSQDGSFSLHALTWLSFTNSRFGRSTREPDTLTLSGLGLWRKNGCRSIQPVAAQFCRSSIAPYVGIQVGLSEVSNVNTRPHDEAAARP